MQQLIGVVLSIVSMVGAATNFTHFVKNIYLDKANSVTYTHVSKASRCAIRCTYEDPPCTHFSFVTETQICQFGGNVSRTLMPSAQVFVRSNYVSYIQDHCNGRDCFCATPVRGSNGGGPFDTYANRWGVRVTGFRVCESGLQGYTDVAAGFDLYYSDGTMRLVVECFNRVNPHPLIHLSTGEYIIQTQVYLAATNVPVGIGFATNIGNQYGPYGQISYTTVHVDQGYALAGARGRIGWVLDAIGFYWEDCMP